MLSVLTCNYNTLDFINPLCKSLKLTTSSKFKILISSPTSQKISKSLDAQIFYEDFDLEGSFNHGARLNSLIQKVDTPYVLIVDSDCFIVKKSWDLELLDLIKNGFKLVGAEHFRKDKITESPLLHANFLFGFTEDFEKVDFKPNFSKNRDTGGNLSAFLGPKNLKELKHNSNPQHNFLNVKCAEYLLGNEAFHYHYGRGGTIRGGKQNLKKWLRECKALLDMLSS